MPEIRNLLVIEDSDPKWERMEAVLAKILSPMPHIVRATDQMSGNTEIMKKGWDLVLLDMSLDIRRTPGRLGQGGHDYTGGLKIAGRMFYNRCEAPTIIVTGFDNFPTGRSGHNLDVILGLDDIERQARQYLGCYLIAIIRYAEPGWERRLIGHLEEFVAS